MRARDQTFRKRFGQRVRAARQAAGFSQRQLAERADVTDKYLSRIEGGAVAPSVLIAARIATSVGVGLDALVGANSGANHDARLGALVSRLSELPSTGVDRAIRVLQALLDE